MEPSPAAYKKKATAMLDEAARARLCRPFVGGTGPSPERADADDDDGLVDLVDVFYNGYDQQGMDGGVVAKDDRAPRCSEWKETLRAILADAAADVTAARIRVEAERVLLDAALGNTGGGGGVRKRLVEGLRARGFDAGLCRSSWDKSSSIPAPGAHEYVDVTTGSSPSSSSTRYIVEVSIASEFDIARPSAAYRDLLRSLPPTLVARPDAFEQVAAAMCAAAADSIRGAGMHVAPWRRARYVQAKWSAQYKRVPGLTPVATADLTRREATADLTRREATADLTRREATVSRDVPPAVLARTQPEKREEAATRAVAHARRSSGCRKNCGMEIGRRELAMGFEALMNVRPLFRGM